MMEVTKIGKITTYNNREDAVTKRISIDKLL